ncbi:MAG: 30S ribosomal protein S19 [Candidatus Lindowbacteria bacterium RIFCSPLOWO2_12_FULL_62_27]|nr:ribosomal protein S19 [uncultured bacterium]OGH56636.1 MAG: 30S ribosomal protein S19 [Candidatus Lindowbacteria bacterium RIFCSPLOWO2_02_FULL_62_12]OGH59713.1 MAG: 30S ribosomal protein S19 [Candidatus Lindowbacteria bacterium RIFCSPLOWO2_12_FULL_62_27]
MSRSLKKGPYVDEGLLRKVKAMRASGQRRAIKTWARRATIVPEMVGQSFSVHNGNKFLNVFVSENMVGHKLGEFALTRTFRGHREPRGGEEAKATA